MGSLENFLGKPKKVIIDGNEIEIQPLKVKDLNLFANEKPTPEEAKSLTKQILKLSIPGSTDEEIDNLSMDSFMKIMEEINKINGFKDERIERIKEKIAQASIK